MDGGLGFRSTIHNTLITEDRLVLSALQQEGTCVNPVGSSYFTLIFAAE